MLGHSYICTLLENKKLLGKSRGVKYIMAAGCWKHMTTSCKTATHKLNENLMKDCLKMY